MFFNGRALGCYHSCPLSEETSWPHKHTSRPRTTAILAQQTSPGPQPALNTGSELRPPATHMRSGPTRARHCPPRASLHPRACGCRRWYGASIASSAHAGTSMLDLRLLQPEIWDGVAASKPRKRMVESTCSWRHAPLVQMQRLRSWSPREHDPSRVCLEGSCPGILPAFGGRDVP